MMAIRYMDEKSEYYDQIVKATYYIQKEYPVEVCFSALVGSTAMGLRGIASDVDFFVFYKSKEGLTKEVRELFYVSLAIGLLDVQLLDISTPELSLVEYGKVKTDYPEHMTRFITYHTKFDYNELPGENNCKLASLLSEVFFYNRIYDPAGYIKNNCHDLTKRLVIYDFLKRRYGSSKGRLTNFLITKGESRLRSYLHNAYEIFTIKHVLETHELPSPNFWDLLKDCEPGNIKDILTDYFHINEQSEISSKELFIDPCYELNRYFMQELDALKPRLIEWYQKRRFETFNVLLKEEGSN